MIDTAAALVLLISLHLCTFLSTALRIWSRFDYFIWLDDGLAALAGVGGLFMGGILYASSTVQHVQPVIVRISLLTYFIVLWLSRTSLVMSVGRLINERKRLQFSVITSSLIGVGIAYGIASAYVCRSATQICQLPRGLILSALIVDIVVDAGVILMNWRAVTVVTRLANIRTARKFVVFLGFSCSICTITINSAFWAFYLTNDPKEMVLQSLLFANGVVIVGIIACNASVIAGVISRTFEDRASPLIQIRVTQTTVLGTPLPAPSTVVAATVISIVSPAALTAPPPELPAPVAPTPVIPLRVLTRLQ